MPFPLIAPKITEDLHSYYISRLLYCALSHTAKVYQRLLESMNHF